MSTRTGGGYGGKAADEPVDEGKTSAPSSPSSKEADGDDDNNNGGGGKTTTEEEGKTSPSSGSTGGTGEEREQAPIIIEAGGRRGGPNLVQRFVDYVFRVIHTEMDDFFTRNAELFDQDWDDFNQQGETLEQYSVFKRYEELLDVHLTKFADSEQFENAADCFVELQRLVTEDAEEHKKRMEEMQEQLRKAQENQNGGSGGSGGSGKVGEETKPQPLMIFFQPISLEQLMQMVLNMAEYPTFSFMMRMKVQQVKLIKAIREQMAQHTADARAAQDNQIMEVEDIELINDGDFETTTERMNTMDGGGKSPEGGSNRK